MILYSIIKVSIGSVYRAAAILNPLYSSQQTVGKMVRTTDQMCARIKKPWTIRLSVETN